jgi:RecB family exonuclease
VERDAYRRRLRTGESWATIIRDDIEEGDALADLLDDASWATDQSAADGFWTLWTRLPQFDRFIEGSANSAFRAAWASLMQALTRQEERDPTISLARYAELADREDFEATPLLRFRDDSGDRLTLTTLHQAKGLEFDVVFIADAVEGVFPDLRRQRSLLQTRLLSPHQDTDPASARTFRLQEEMRLAYTAMTRARRRVVWTATDAGIDEGERRPSRFLGALGVEPTTGTSSDAPPITPLEAEAYLRRALVDPGRANGLRLAAAHLLVARPNPAVRPVDEFALVRSRGSDRGLVGEDLRLSPSQAEAYVSCPRRYALERRLDAAGESGPYAGFGSLIHDVLEETEKAAAERGDTHGTLDEALLALDRHFETADFGASGWRTAWKKRAERLLRGLYLDWIRPEARPVLLEHTLELELDGVLWRGRADRIELTPAGTTRIVDYKTTTSPKPRKEAASSIQLGFYLMAARRDPVAASFGEPAEAEFWYPLAGSKHVPFDPATLPLVEEAMRTVAAGIRAEDWTPTVSGDCERCPVRIVCPEWPEGRESFSR